MPELSSVDDEGDGGDEGSDGGGEGGGEVGGEWSFHSRQRVMMMRVRVMRRVMWVMMMMMDFGRMETSLKRRRRRG